MHRAFKCGFEKVSYDHHKSKFDTKPQRPTKYDWTPTVVYTGAGVLGGMADYLVSSNPSKGRAAALMGIGAAMGALEGTRLGPDAPLSHKVMHTLPAIALGGGTAWVMSHGLSRGKRLGATALSAIASGLTSSL
jgi:hypothetical protein